MLMVFIVFLILLFLGVPVGFSLLIGGAMFFFQNPWDTLLMTIVQLPITQTQNVTLLAVPLFILAGNLMNISGITTRLLRLAMALTGHMRGGLAQVSVVLSTLMGGVSGSANADVAMQSRILGPNMIKHGYSKGYTSCNLAFTAIITAILPPGVSMIMFGTVGNVSIGRLFAAGLSVGFLMMVLYMTLVAITARVYNFKPATDRRTPVLEILPIIKETFWAILFPIMLLVGIRMGLFTPSEIGAFACVYAIFIGFVVYRELTLKKLWEAMKMSVIDIGKIMFMIAMAAVLGYGIPFERLPQRITLFMSELTANPYILIIMIVVFLIIVGMIIDGAILIILTTPILLPLIQDFGIDPIVFGIIVCTVVTMGNMTPPVGIAMFTSCTILETPLEDYIRQCLPFILVILVTVAICIIFPQFVLFMPNLIFG